MKRERTTTTTSLSARHLSMPALVMLIAVGLMSFAGCDLFIDGGDSSRNARFEARLDADPIPIDFVDEANVTISRVELVGRESGRVTVSSKDRTINLLNLTSGASALLGEEHVRPGRYDEIRLFIDDAEIVLDNGTTYDIEVPDRRVRIGLDNFVIRGNDNVVLTLTFDVDDSFEVRGDPDSAEGITGFFFEPVIVTSNVDRSDWDGHDDDWEDDRHDDDDDDEDDDDDDWDD